MSTYVGIDWGGKRWVQVIDTDGDISIETAPSLYTVWNENSDADQILIDIPMGLPSKPEMNPRPCDKAASDFLQPFLRSSVFPVPCRAAVRADDYSRAKDHNKSILNEESLGPQTWGIAERIYEADVLINELDLWPEIRESHPEVCFEALSEDGIDHRKSSEEGFLERFDIIDHYHTPMEEAIENLRQRVDMTPPWKRRIGIGMIDDVLDASVLALTARLGSDEGFEVLGGQENSEGQSMEIVYAQ